MVSDKHKVIFVHIPRTAGHTVSACFDYKRNKNDKVKRHATPYQYIQIHPTEWNDYYTFTFIRNPWARILSAWYIKAYRHKDQEEVKLLFNKFVKNDLKRIINTEPGHFKSQLFWILDEDEKQYNYDYIGKSDPDVLLYHLNNIRKDIGLSLLESLPKLGASGYSSSMTFKDFYTDQSIKIVSNLYKKEIEFLEYSF